MFGGAFKKQSASRAATLSRVLAFSTALVCTGDAQAQSNYGCSGLTGRHSLPSVEGLDGVFFPIDPDLKLFHSISDESVARVARLAEALQGAGTTLIYMPVPTRALAMPQYLNVATRDFGFDTDLAATVYDDNIRRLGKAGVIAVNMRHALRASAVAFPFFATDPRLTPDGAQVTASAIASALTATPEFEGLPKARFTTQAGGAVDVPSVMRSKLQRHCLSTLPSVTATRVTTSMVQAAPSQSNGSIFAARDTQPRVALVSTDIIGSEVSNLAGYLSQETGLEVLQYSVQGGDSFAAISTYLTSAAFDAARPTYLIWANPVANSLANFGHQPFAELTAAAAGNCRVAVPFVPAGNLNTLRADLSRLDPRGGFTLFLDSGGAQAAEAQFDFVSRAGLVMRKSVRRHRNQVKTGRFFMPMTGLWPDGAQAVDISLDTPFGPGARLSACVQ